MTTPLIRYLVASTPRTGSQLLCEGLINTGVAGSPVEPFYSANLPFYSAEWDLGPNPPFNEYFAEVLRRCTTPNGVFGLRIHWPHVSWLQDQIGGDPNVLALLFPNARYINLTRRDLRGQAISLHRGQHNRLWVRTKEDAPVGIHVGKEATFDAPHIFELEHLLTRDQNAWLEYFSSHSIEPLTIEYESLARYHRHEVSRVLAFIDQDQTLAHKIPEPRLLKQADATTMAWRRLLNAHEHGRSRL